jgi:hypothetical protein
VDRGKYEVTVAEREILDRQPEADDAMRVIVEAWNDLHTCRPLGMNGAGLIPFTATLAWAQYRSLDREATEILMNVINRLDCDRAQRMASKDSLR